MAECNCTAGLRSKTASDYRRLYMTMCAACVALAELAEQRENPGKSYPYVLEALEVFMTRVNDSLDLLGVPRDWPE